MKAKSNLIKQTHKPKHTFLGFNSMFLKAHHATNVLSQNKEFVWSTTEQSEQCCNAML